MTRSTVIFLGPLPGSSHTRPFCEAHSGKGKKGQGGQSAGVPGAHGAADHRGPRLGETLPPGGAHRAERAAGRGRERCARLRVTAAPAASPTPAAMCRDSGLIFSRGAPFFSRREKGHQDRNEISVSQSSDSPHDQEKPTYHNRFSLRNACSKKRYVLEFPQFEPGSAIVLPWSCFGILSPQHRFKLPNRGALSSTPALKPVRKACSVGWGWGAGKQGSEQINNQKLRRLRR